MMQATHRIVALTVAAAALAPFAHAGTVYKWTDARGVVNYSTAPPPEAQRLVRVDTTPAVAAAGAASDTESAASHERRLREQMQQIDTLRQARELAQAREQQQRHEMQLARQAADTEEARRRLAREQCLRERRIDCDAAPGVAYVPAPVVVVRRAPPQNIRQVSPFPVSGPSLGPAPGTIAGTQAQLAPFRAAPPVPVQSAGFRVPR
ncbi:MAG: DUF4124 domain-containing protein [Burkholderiales bacterium]|nr:DUF4124 domain-containing protein [Burkholderiales bacterium]